MINLFCKGVMAALMAADTPTALNLLGDGQGVFLDPLEGATLHAEILYCAIKHANRDVITWLMNLCISSDVSFYNYCGHTPVGLVLEEGLNDMLPLMLSKTDKSFALYTAVQLKNTKLQDLLLRSCIYKEKFLKYLKLR
jgi:hypothetical protein